MSKSLGGWIHSFTVTDAVTHKDGYTIYKITSIVFPRSIPEALTCITVWKRFHEIKKLYRELSKRHKSLQLRGQLPEPKDSFFKKRFDPELIELRKSYILELLDFIAQHPALYKSHTFLNFFENDNNTPQTSPIHRLYHHDDNHYYHNHKKQQNQKYDDEDENEQKGSNIEKICDNLDLTYDNEISLIDPNKDIEIEQENDKKNIENNEKVLNERKGFQIETQSQEETLNSEEDRDKNRDTANQSESNSNRILVPTISFEGEDNDYIYEAAYEFSQAVQAEVNHEYRNAYEKYKLGVDKLLTGSKDDSNEERKFIAKAKVTKYMNRAEELYEKYLLNTEDNTKTVQLSIDITDTSKEIYLERPWNQLSKFKVIQIIDNIIMQVQDVTDKCLYIMKSIDKPLNNSNLNTNLSIMHTHSIFLPQDVPYMVKLLGFFQSDTTIYLLLRQAKGGKLFNHIQTYTPTGHITKSLNEIFTDYYNDEILLNQTKNNKEDNISNKEDNSSNKDDNCKNNEKIQNDSLLLTNYYDSGFIELLNEYKNDDNISSLKENINEIDTNCSANNDNNSITNCSLTLQNEKVEQQNDYIPSFDTLSEDMDVNDLLSCSQKLLKSVSNTLEQFKETKINNDNEILERIKLKIDNKDDIKLENSNKIQLSQSSLSLTSLQIMGLHTNKHRTILPEVSIKQWARELITAINSLHQKGVILGDLRPDNLLLGSKGQLLLSYFYQSEGGHNYNSHKYLNYDAIENLYVAPERPLTIKSDCWSFGVILFELLTGYSFKLCHPGNLSSYYEIQYPDNEISNIAKDLLNQILQYNPEYRLNIDGIKMHRFFEGTQWDEIAKRGINSY